MIRVWSYQVHPEFLVWLSQIVNIIILHFI